MKKTTKAMLASAFVVPGLGHWVLNKKIHAVSFILAALYCLYMLLEGVHKATMRIMEKALENNIAIDVVQINKMVHDSPELASLSNYLWVLVLIWIVALIDTYRIGSAQDTATKAEG